LRPGFVVTYTHPTATGIRILGWEDAELIVGNVPTDAGAVLRIPK
jgi:hypothetical protein